MTTLDIVVLLFGALISGLVGAGFLLMFYGHAFIAQSEREASQVRPGSARVAEPLVDERS